jgi:hypothetical protein
VLSGRDLRVLCRSNHCRWFYLRCGCCTPAQGHGRSSVQSKAIKEFLEEVAENELTHVAFIGKHSAAARSIVPLSNPDGIAFRRTPQEVRLPYEQLGRQQRRLLYKRIERHIENHVNGISPTRDAPMGISGRPLLAPRGPRHSRKRCPLWRTKQTLGMGRMRSACDPSIAEAYKITD